MATLTRAQMLALLADNTSGDISAKDLRDIITGVATLADDTPTYDYKKVTDFITTSDTYVSLAELITPTREAGTYEIKISTTFTYNSISKSAYFRWSIDGGTNWEEFSVEPKDFTDKKAMSYSFPYPYLGGVMDIKLECKCEASSDTLDVLFANIVFERKA